MRKAIATLGIVGLGLMTATVPAHATTPDHKKKITICHATGSATNPFVAVTISLKALNGHTGAHHSPRDIVPVNSGHIMPQGQNLTPANLAILANGCASVVVVPPVDPVDPPVDPDCPPVDPVDPPVDPVDPPVDPVDPVDPPVDPVDPPVDPVDPPVDPVDPPVDPVDPVDPPVDPVDPVVPPVDPPVEETSVEDEEQESAAPASAVMASAATVVAPKAAAPAAKKTNVGYNVQTAVGQTPDTGIPVWLMALTGILTAGAAMVVWLGARRTRSTEN